MSFLTCMLSNIFKPTQDVSFDEKKDIYVPEPQHTSPPVALLQTLIPYFYICNPAHLINNQLRDDFFPLPPTLHPHRDLLSSISLRFSIIWVLRFHLHLNTFILFPLLPPFSPYDPWPTPAADYPSQGDTDPAGGASGSF